MRRLMTALVLALTFAPTAWAEDDVEVNIRGDGAMNVKAGGVRVTVEPGSPPPPPPRPAPAPPPLPLPPPGMPVAEAQRIEVDGNDKHEEHQCSPGTEVTVSGNDNKVTLRGDCNKVEVSGNSNHVKVDGVSFIDVSGNDNKVHYRRGLRRGEPKITRSGNDNKVVQKGHGRDD